MITRLDIPPDRVIEALKAANLKSIVVIGYQEDGEFYFASNKADGGDVLWALQQAIHRLIETAQ